MVGAYLARKKRICLSRNSADFGARSQYIKSTSNRDPSFMSFRYDHASETSWSLYDLQAARVGITAWNVQQRPRTILPTTPDEAPA